MHTDHPAPPHRIYYEVNGSGDIKVLFIMGEQAKEEREEETSSTALLRPEDLELTLSLFNLLRPQELLVLVESSSRRSLQKPPVFRPRRSSSFPPLAPAPLSFALTEPFLLSLVR